MRTESTSEDCQTDMSEQGSAKKLCATAKGKFPPAINNLELAMTSKAPVTTIESRYDTWRAVWKEIQGKHDAYMKLRWQKLLRRKKMRKLELKQRYGWKNYC